ncbi:MAG: hypothetical protein HQ521_03100 [Bacteroidetes bacterium]|nr:hypothetical protein [Bacteroidota bacterium]
MSVAGFVNVVKAPVYLAKTKILVTSPYNPGNRIVPEAPYSGNLFEDLFSDTNFRCLVIDKINKLHFNSNLKLGDLQKITRIKLSSNSNILEIIVRDKRLSIVRDLADALTESYVLQFNYLQNEEFILVNHKLEMDLKALNDEYIKIFGKFNKTEIKLAKINKTRGVYLGKKNEYKNRLSYNEEFLSGLNEMIKIIKENIRVDMDKLNLTTDFIRNLESRLSVLNVDKSKILGENEYIHRQIVVIEKNMNVLSNEMLKTRNNFDERKHKRAVSERSLTIVSDKIRGLQIKNNENRIVASVLELSRGAEEININLVEILIFYGIGSFVMSALFVWICFI